MTLFKLCLPGGLRKIMAENILIKQQLIVVRRSQRKCPHLSAVERLLFGFWALLMDPKRKIPASVVRKSPWLLRTRFKSSSTRMMCAGFWTGISNQPSQLVQAMDRLGGLFLAISKTHSGHWTFFASNQRLCSHTGWWSLWINIREESKVLLSRPGRFPE